MHNLRATHITESNMVTHLIFEADLEKTNLEKAEIFEIIKSIAFQSTTADLSCNGINETNLKLFLVE